VIVFGGKKVPKHDPYVRCSQGPCGLDERLLLQCDYRCSDDTGVHHPAGDDERGNEVLDARTKCCYERQSKDDQGECKHEIDDPHDDASDEAFVIPGHEAKDDAHRRGADGSGDRREHRRSCAVEDAAPDVATQEVSPKGVLPRSFGMPCGW